MKVKKSSLLCLPCIVIMWFALAPLALAQVSPSFPPTPDAGPAEPSTSPDNDHGDIFLNEGIPNGDGSLSWTNTITVNNDATYTDQWDPAVAVNPAGTELFVGYYSRQSDPSNNALIMAYGAKAPITANSVTSSSFDCFPISTVTFTNLFNGSDSSTPQAEPWLFDHVWVQDGVYLDANADVVATEPPGVVSSYGYRNFTADDYTWAVADSSYFYYTWRDCSDTCTNNYSGTNYVRADANVRLGKIRQ